MENQAKTIKIIKVKKNRQKYEVTFLVDKDEDVLTFYEDEIIEYHIFKDKEYTDTEWEEIKKASSIGQLFNKTLNYISFKMRTEKEIKRYLKEQEVTAENIEKIVNKLINYHFIDDEKYAKLFVSSAVRNGKGINYIKNTLLEKGLESSIIDDALTLYDESEVLEIVVPKLQREASKKTNDSLKRRKDKITSKLLRDGFNTSFIKKVLEQLTFDNDDKEQLKKEYEKVLNKTEDKNKIIARLLAKGYNYADIKALLMNK